MICLMKGIFQMMTLGWITATLLFIGVGGIGMTKLTRNKEALVQAERLGYLRMALPIGIVEVGAAIAVLAGVIASDLAWLGSSAAVGIILMMVGAFWHHHRAGDTFEKIPSVLMLVLSIGYLAAVNGG
jgi:hypothetical protein